MELIVVIAIMMILAGFTATGLVKWIEWSHFKQENECARSIFVAAQNQLNEYAASNRLEEIQNALRGPDGAYLNMVPLERLTDSKGGRYELETMLDKIWPESADKGQYASKYREDICYLMGTPQDYRDYLEGKATEPVQILYDMLTSYLYDTSYLDAAVCIEFTPGDGQVFSVLYSSRQEAFSYVDEGGKANISDRTLNYRRERMIGYYGVDTLYMATTTRQEKPSISGVKLNNEETLNLTFYLSRIKEATQELTYRIAVRDKHSDDDLMVISLDGTRLKNRPSEILCSVDINHGTDTVREKYGIIAWVDSQNIIHVILDAADLSASSQAYYTAWTGLRTGTDESGSAQEFQNTQSFHRFGIDTEDIVCVVDGKGTFYKDTARKKSNDQNTYFASCKKAEDGSLSYAIANARHLYNMRYVEDYTKEQRQGEYEKLMTGPVNYEIRNDIDWRAFIQGGFLYHSVRNKDWAIGTRELGEDLVTDPETPFPSFRQLRATSVLSGGRNSASLSGLSITWESNVELGVYGSTYEENPFDPSGQPVGLFVTNYGVIQNMSLDRIVVKGKERTGAFCGQNDGSLTDLRVLDSGRSAGLACVISGTQDVGGIAGYQMGTENAAESVQRDVVYKRLVNRAKVTGSRYVGGIAGRLAADGGRSVLVDSCSNYGRIEALEYEGEYSAYEAMLSGYIGGIVGYCRGMGSSLTISNCTSSPQYTADEIELLLRQPQAFKKKLNGIFVGGIAGYNENASIVACSSVSEMNRPGYIFGMMYVGGIAGFSEGSNGSALDGSAPGQEYGINESNVFAVMYAGGITGCNSKGFFIDEGNAKTPISHRDVSDVSDFFNGDIYPMDESDMEAKLTNWLNRGAVFASGSEERFDTPKAGYAGGITGYNSGWIYHCNSEVGITGEIARIESSGLFDSRFVGGVAGSNYGMIGNTKRDDQGSIIQGADDGSDDGRRLYTVCYVSGNSLVGGIVGYNAVDAIVEDYAVAGGYVRATGSYVGGYAGFNASKYLLMKEDGQGRVIASNPNEISGTYCVGGIIGGNVLSLENDEQVSAVFEADNFLGKLSASAFAGGYIGFNTLVSPLEDSAGNRYSREEVNAVLLSRVQTSLKILDDMFHLEEIETENDREKEERLTRALAMADTWHTDVLRKTDGVLHISGKTFETGEGNSVSQLGGIRGEIYVAGVVGYNDEESGLKISSVVNMTPVSASFAIENKEEQSGGTYLGQPFKYSYTGGIIGKVGRLVTVENCRNQGVGDVTAVGTYTGGLCEINEGLILNCQASSVGEAGKDYVGGIAGLNKSGGRIEHCSFTDKTVTGRNYVGGLAAENYGVIENPRLGSDDGAGQGAASGGAIQAYGSEEQGYAGGVTGRNYGSGSIYLAGGRDLWAAVASNGSNTGGVAGYNEGSIAVIPSSDGNSVVSINGWVTGYKNVGGVVGYNAANTDTKGFYGYVNAASVTAGFGAAGGIAGLNADKDTVIDSCTNTGEITAPNAGNAGGILGENSGLVRDCQNTGKITAPNGICGGIAGTNAGIIQASRVYSALSERLEFTGSLYVGGICGVNTGVIKGGSVNALKLSNLSGSAGSAVGGVAGDNRGEQALIEKVSAGAGTALSGSLSDIEKADPDQNKDMLVLVSFASDVDMGGVAGRNTGAIKGMAAAEEYTPVYAGLSFYETSMSYYGNLGGIAGANTGDISGYEFNGSVEGTANNPQSAPEYNPNTDYETNGSVIYGYGGIAGINGSSSSLTRSSISGCRVNIASVTGLGDANNIANIGGIAGVNSLGAVISNVSFGSSEVYKLHNNVTSRTIPAVKNACEKVTGSVFVGTKGTESAKSTDYAHTGAVAGLNSGRIFEVGMEKVLLADGTVSWQVTDEMDASCVLVENFRGHVGGITGYNRRTGIVEQSSTGGRWIVFAPQNAQDNGCGGIAGYSASENGLLYCVNKAVVVKAAGNSNGVGGMVGRLECATSANWAMDHCINYGSIYGNNRVGGMIGVWKYYGGTVSDCVNYGRLTAYGDEGVGGMVGSFYKLSTTPARMTGCENHGLVNTENKGGAGGIAGKSSGGASCVWIERCVNTGIVNGGDSAGILNTSCNLANPSHLSGCTNYGYVAGGNGITGNNANLSVDGCLGAADLTYPVSSRKDGTGNYYISGKALPEGDVSAFYVEKIEAPGIAQNGYLGQLVQYEKLYGENTFSTNAYFKNTSLTGSWDYIFTFSKAVKLSEIDLKWFRSSTFRSVNYTVYGQREGSSEWVVLGEKQNFNQGQVTVQDLRKMTKEEEQLDVSDSEIPVRKVKIHVTDSAQVSGEKVAGAHVCLLKFWIKGMVSGDGGEYNIPYDGASEEEENITAGKYLVLKEGTAVYETYPDPPRNAGGAVIGAKKKAENPIYYQEDNAIHFDLAPAKEQEGEEENKGLGNPLKVADYEEGGYRLLAETSSGRALAGIPGFPIDPTDSLTGSGVFKTDSSLTANGDASDNIRYQIFKADHEYFDLDGAVGVTQLYFTSTQIRFSSGENASYKAQWDEVKNALYYQYKISYYGEDLSEPLRKLQGTVYDPYVEIPVSAINGTPVKQITVSVRAGAKSLIDGKLQEIWTKEWISADQEVGDILPTPRFHFELDYNSASGTLQYVCYLDNQEDYREFLAAQGLSGSEAKEALAGIEISVTGNNWTGKITADQSVAMENGKVKYYGGSDGNKIYTAVAKPKGGGQDALKYVASQKVLRESQAYDHKLITGGKVASVSQDGFYGSTVDSLAYKVNVQAVNGDNAYIFYMRSELTAVMEEIGVPVSLSSAQVRVSNTTSASIAVLLNKLPAELLDPEVCSNIMVRSYPAVISNNVVYMGHSVDIEAVKAPEEESAAGISKETLLKLYVTADRQVTLENTGQKLIWESQDGSRKLAPGFVIELSGDGSYTLYYNSLLYYNENELGFEYDQGSMKTQVFFKKLSEQWEKMPSPIIHVNYDEQSQTDGDVNEDMLEITWDLENYRNESGAHNYQPGAEYDYTVVGYTDAGDGSKTASQIAAGYYVTGRDGENTLIFDTSTWSFKRIEITVNRRGEVDAAGRTKKYPSSCKLLFSMKTRFSQIARPTVSLTTDASGNVEKNTLLYQAVWSPIPDSERFTKRYDGAGQTAAQDNLAYYEVEVRRSGNDTAALQQYASREEYTKAWQRLSEIYGNRVETYGGVCEETQNGKTFKWVQTQQGVTVQKTMELSQEDETLSIEQNLTLLWQCPAGNMAQGAETVSQVLDLNEYERNEILEISVKAVAKEDGAGLVIPYRDGPEGVARELALPGRLYVPDVASLNAAPQYDREDSVTRKEFTEQGFTMRYTGGLDSQVQQKYEMAAAVYWTRPDDADDRSQAAAGDDIAGSWNENAAWTLLRKSDSVTMEGNAWEAALNLNTIPARYAGRWLKVAMRGISDSNISSWWSDEDESADATLNYRWLRLPRVQVETPEWTESEEEVYYEEQEEGWQVDWEKGSQIHVKQTALSFLEREFSDGYQLQLVHALERTGEEFYASDVDWIYLVKDEDGYQVYYQTTDQEGRPQEASDGEALQECFMDPDAVLIGTLGPDNTTLLLPRATRVRCTASGDDSITLNSYLEWQEGSIKVVLPDALQVDYGGEVHSGSPEDTEYSNSYLYTSQASVQGRLSEADEAYFEDSLISKWYRQLVNSEYESVTGTMDDYAPAPDISWTGQEIQISLTDGLAFEASVSCDVGSRLVYRIEVLDEADNVIHCSLGSAWVYDDQSSYLNLIHFDGDEYAVYSKNRVRITMAACVAGNNVTKWSKPVEGMLPELIVQEVEEKDIMDASGAVAGKEYSWQHHFRASDYVILLTCQDGNEYCLSTSGLKTGDYEMSWNQEEERFEWSPVLAQDREGIRLHISESGEHLQYRLTVMQTAWTDQTSFEEKLNILSGGNVSGADVLKADASKVDVSKADVSKAWTISGSDVSGADNVGGGVSGSDAKGGDVSGGSVPDSIPYARLNDLVKPPALQRLRIKAVSVFKGYEPVILEKGFSELEKGYSE